jgi:hypothetical protein
MQSLGALHILDEEPEGSLYTSKSADDVIDADDEAADAGEYSFPEQGGSGLTSDSELSGAAARGDDGGCVSSVWLFVCLKF